MIYIEAPSEYDENRRSVFLAGGISDCDDWQTRLAAMLTDTDLVVLNPRRRSFPGDEIGIEEAQIRWEFRHMRRAGLRAFWFPPQTLCPITLYELGAWSMTDRPLLVGVDPAYARRADVEIQTCLARPEVQIESSLDDLAARIKTWCAAGVTNETHQEIGR